MSQLASSAAQCPASASRREAETEELALIYRPKGLDAEEASRLAETIMKTKSGGPGHHGPRGTWLDTDELGSPWSAALSSLIAFGVGWRRRYGPRACAARTRAVPVSAR
jgi:hypothetical protein